MRKKPNGKTLLNEVAIASFVMTEREGTLVRLSVCLSSAMLLSMTNAIAVLDKNIELARNQLKEAARDYSQACLQYDAACARLKRFKEPK